MLKKAKGRQIGQPPRKIHAGGSPSDLTTSDQMHCLQTTMQSSSVLSFDDVVRACAERFASAPHEYFLDDWRGNVLVLKFYGDESYGAREPGFQGCYSVAGYITSAEVWQNDIADDWRAALDAPPKIDYFRMSDCFSAIRGTAGDKSPFSGMPTLDAKKKLEAVVSVIERHAHKMAGTQSIITWDCFMHALSAEDKELLRSPYYFCLNGIVDGCRQILQDMERVAPVAFVFDERNDVSELIHHAWNVTKKNSPEDAAIMGSIAFEDDRACWPLQCADLVAWHVRRDFIKPAEDHGRSRPEYTCLINSVGRWYSHIWNESNLRQDRAAKWQAFKATQGRHPR